MYAVLGLSATITDSPHTLCSPVGSSGRVWGKKSNHKQYCRDNLHTAIVAGWRPPRYSAHAPSDQVACPRHDKVPPQHGAFLTNCPAHCQTGTHNYFAKTTIGGTTMGDAFLAWFTASMGEAAGHGIAGVGNAPPHMRWIERCDTTPCAPDMCS